MIYGILPTKFFETFVALAVQKGLSPSVAAEEAGLNRSAVTAWKKGRIPGEATLSKLTAYFGVTKQYLLEGPPGESESGNKIESFGEMQEDSPVADEVSSADTLEEENRLESRSFVKFALNLLTIYCPDKTVESLANQLKISPNVFKALEDDRFDIVLVDSEWKNRFYSLLEDKNVLLISRNLRRALDLLEIQRKKSIMNKIPQIIWDYMYQKGLDFEFVKEEIGNWRSRYSYTGIMKLKDSGKHWMFYFAESTINVYGSYLSFVRDNFKWINDIPDIERFVIMFTYTENSVSDGGLAEFKRRLCKAYPNEIRTLLSKTQLFLYQISGITLEFIEEEQVKLSALPNLQVD